VTIAVVSIQEQTAAERITAEREQYVSRGVTTPRLVVARAEGARIEDVDGRSFVDFAGGIGCQNTGHGVAIVDDDLERGLELLDESLAATT
jgi:4-aminobutyrate aminotransferase-like enzyme